jgi:hypothetical protein
MSKHELIYKATLEATSKEDLKDKLNQFAKSNKRFSIDDKLRDVKTHHEFTVAGRLAYENKPENQKKIEWLRELNANPTEIAMGYAMAGAFGKAEEYRGKYQADPNKIIHAYILGNQKQYINAYLKFHNVSIKTIISALALTGDEGAIDRYYTHCEEKLKSKKALEELLSSICYYSAMGGHDRLVTKYYTKYEGNTEALIPSIVEAYAVGGHHASVLNHLAPIVKKKEDISSNLLFKAAAQGYAKGGHHKYVKQLYQCFPKIDPCWFAEGYKERGDTNKVKEYDLNALLDAYLSERTALISNKKTKNYKTIPLPFFQHSFQEKKEAVTALKRALNNEHVDDLMSHLSTLRNGNLGKSLRKFIKKGMADCLVGDKVRTVTDFVIALDYKIKDQDTILPSKKT